MEREREREREREKDGHLHPQGRSPVGSERFRW